jgi:hypothetical protein
MRVPPAACRGDTGNRGGAARFGNAEAVPLFFKVSNSILMLGCAPDEPDILR